MRWSSATKEWSIHYLSAKWITQEVGLFVLIVPCAKVDIFAEDSFMTFRRLTTTHIRVSGY
jgi:hypothetical protein